MQQMVSTFSMKPQKRKTSEAGQAGHEGVGVHDEPAVQPLNREEEDGGKGDPRGEMLTPFILTADHHPWRWCGGFLKYAN